MAEGVGGDAHGAGGEVDAVGEHDRNGNLTVGVVVVLLNIEYDEGDRPSRAYDQEGNQVYTVRDVDGRNQCSVDPNGNVTWYIYWGLGRGQEGSTRAPTSGVRAVSVIASAAGRIYRLRHGTETTAAPFLPGDRDLLDLIEYQGVRIVTAAQALRIITGDRAAADAFNCVTLRFVDSDPTVSGTLRTRGQHRTHQSP